MNSEEKENIPSGTSTDNASQPFVISANNDINERLLRSWTSANFLCNFVTKPDYLKEIIRNMAFKPRYVEEKIEYLQIDNLPAITFPMTCFCDIPLSKLKTHMEVYGSYGLALKKQKVMCRDIQPILYLNPESRLAADLSYVLSSLRSKPRVDEQWKELPDFILSILLYSKPVSGKMKRREWTEPKDKLFKDECEWRYIPLIPNDELPLVMPQKDTTAKGIRTYSIALGKIKSTWFHFDVDEVEYIIVPDEASSIEFAQYIRRQRKLSSIEKSLLISKIEIASRFETDLV